FSIDPTTNQIHRYDSVTHLFDLYTYDASGNMVNSGTSDIGGHSYTYNALSQITTVDETDWYAYDGLDQRGFKATLTEAPRSIYFNGQVVAEQNYDNGDWTDYIYANGQKIAKIATPTTGPSTTNYYLDDHLGTTQVELDASGAVTWQGQFTPFGMELPDGSTT